MLTRGLSWVDSTVKKIPGTASNNQIGRRKGSKASGSGWELDGNATWNAATKAFGCNFSGDMCNDGL
jgi:hypothetical protein